MSERIEVQTLIDWSGYWAKGHHSPLAFLRAVHHYEGNLDCLVGCSWRPRHEYGRWLNHTRAQSAALGYTRSLLTAKGPARGAFPITLLGQPL